METDLTLWTVFFIAPVASMALAIVVLTWSDQ